MPRKVKLSCRDPFEEGDRLRDLVGGKRRRVRAIGLDRLDDAGAHRRPVPHRGGDVGVDLSQAGDEPLAGLRLVDTVEVDVDEALALHRPRRGGGRLADEADEGAGGIPLDGEDRMRDEDRLVALVDDLGEGGIEQERHVVVDDLEDGDVAAAAAALDFEIDEAEVGAAGRPRRLQMGEGGGGELGEGARGVGGEVLRRDAAEEIDDEGGRHLRVARGQNGGRLGREGTSDGRHVVSHARSPPLLSA